MENITLRIGVKKIKKNKNTVRWMCVIKNLNGEEIVGMFYENELQKKKKKKNKLEFTVGKVIIK